MPLGSADVVNYLLAAALPVVLLLLFSLFRSHYLRAVERAISAEAPAPGSSGEPSPGNLPHQPVVLVSEHPAAERIPAGPDLLLAQREEAAYRTALALSGLLFVTLGALLMWWRFRYQGDFGAVGVAYVWTLPGILLIVVFVRRGWIAVIGSVMIWFSVGVLLHRAWLGTSSSTLTLFQVAVALAGPPTLTVGLLALRATRPILVGLVPLVLVWVGLSLAVGAAFSAFGISLEGGFTWRAFAAGPAAAALGIGLAVRQIRRGLTKGLVVLLIGVTLGGALLILGGELLGGPDGFNIASAIVAGVGLNSLLTLATWWLFVRFVRFRANGGLPDEVLHYGCGWLGLMVYPGLLAWPWKVLPFVAFGVTLQRLLQHLRRRAATRVPRRLLLLRPFNDGRLRSDLLDALDGSWRRTGTVDLVVGGDLAVRTISGPVLESVLAGTVQRHFLRQPDEVDDRLARLPRHVALDGRFPLNEVHCDPAVWQAVVTALADVADVVLMDLRGMRARNRGALFELRMAVQRVELSRIVLLADPRTDERALTEVAEEAWRARPDSVPGRVDTDPRLVVLRCTGRVARDNAWIIERVFAACGHEPRRLARDSLQAERADRPHPHGTPQ